MPTVTIKRTNEIRDRILQALRERSYRPVELIQHIQSPEITESAVKDVLAELIDASLIELSPDRHITLRHTAGPLAAAR
jgi:hypothetical protein